MVIISRERYERSGVETIVYSNAILLLNERLRLDHKNLWMTTGKYLSDHFKKLDIN